MQKIMIRLHARFTWLVEARWFKRLMVLTILLNPVAYFSQVLSVFLAPSVEGISLLTFGIFGAIQVALGFEAIRTKSAGVFIAMLLSIVESVLIIIVVLIRKS